MSFISNFSISELNTFKIEAQAAFYSAFYSIEELIELIPKAKDLGLPLLVLGGGSNMLLTSSIINKTVLHNKIGGITWVTIDADTVEVVCGAGVLWHNLVMAAVENGLYGIENMALIPGTVGAAPMQNIGAYGMELKDTFVSLQAVELETCLVRTFSKNECKFGYRDSFFKREGAGKYIITSVTLRLKKSGHLNFSYKGLEESYTELGFAERNLKTLAHSVIHVRQSKLPDPAFIGNAGSFFKNPELPIETAKNLASKYPDLPQWPQADGTVKIPAAWLIEQAGWKGYREDDFGVHDKQPLVIVNYGKAQGSQIKELAFKVIASVKQKFGVELSPEVNLIQ